MNNIKPSFMEKAFSCPYCGVYAQQHWVSFCTRPLPDDNLLVTLVLGEVYFAVCSHCEEYSIWEADSMIYPYHAKPSMINPDLPENIKSDYKEAVSIANRSPRGSAALLRLVIQKLCIHLGEKGEKLNDDIGNLVKRGLPEKIQKSLDIVRVIGNNAVHPGTIDLRDDIQTVEQLFELINIIAEYTITQNKLINSIYKKLPDKDKNGIDKRDGKQH
jgi:transcription elongation factor Elf1